jgi:hypothetical protein
MMTETPYCESTRENRFEGKDSRIRWRTIDDVYSILFILLRLQLHRVEVDSTMAFETPME